MRGRYLKIIIIDLSPISLDPTLENAYLSAILGAWAEFEQEIQVQC